MDTTPKEEVYPDLVIEYEDPPVYKDQSGPNDFYAMLKNATALKKNGNIDAAIKELEKARSMRNHPDLAYLAEYEIKYANYLQLAGRNDEGWGVLNKARIDSSFQFGAEQARIVDAMRIYLQKEGRNDDAISSGAVSLILNINTICHCTVI